MRWFVKFVHFVMGRFYYNWCYLYYWNYFGQQFKDNSLCACKGFSTASSMEHKWFKCEDCPYKKKYERSHKNDDQNR